MCTNEGFESLANELLSSTRCQNSRFYSALFGVSSTVSQIVWAKICTDLPQSASPRHLLWALYFLKGYGTEERNSVVFGVTEKTYRTWVWVVVRQIASLQLVCTLHAIIYILILYLSHLIFLISNLSISVDNLGQPTAEFCHTRCVCFC